MEKYYSTPDISFDYYFDYSTARPVPDLYSPKSPLPSFSPVFQKDQKCQRSQTCLKNENDIFWPVILLIIVGISLALYTAIGFQIKEEFRLFGALFIFLWTVMWCLILWVLWNNKQYMEAWGVMLIPLVLVLLFFFVIVVSW